MRKDADQMTIDELRAKDGSLRGALLTVLGLCVLYVLTLLWFWFGGRWSHTQTLGLVPLLTLGVVAISVWSSRRKLRALIDERTRQALTTAGSPPAS